MFLGSTCKTIMDETSNNLEAVISDLFEKEFDNRLGNKCRDCNALNLTDAKYCSQ